ncbi:MAG: lactate permease [Actinomycetota bacterium]|jgi:lactate permease|nr:lactate permease [Actinomycetota bacterium]
MITAYRPVLDAVGGSLFLTALVAMLPLLTLFIVLGVMKLPAWKAALASLSVSLVVAIVAYGMPVGQALLAGSQGAAFGIFPILWIVINAIWVYNMTVVTGHFDVLRRSFAKVSDDQRIQAIIIAFCFGGLLEALAGFGTPVAITTVMLMALGFKPVKAAVVALVANTAPVAFGALAVPLITLSTNSGIPEQTLSTIVGRQTAILAFFVPMALVFIIDKWRGVRQTLPATLTAGSVFAVVHYLMSSYVSMPLTDIVASLVAAASLVLVLRVWQPAEKYTEAPEIIDAAGAGVGSSTRAAARNAAGNGGGSTATATKVANLDHHDSGSDVFKAYAPYLIIVAIFCIASLIPAVKHFLESTTQKFQWPGLDLQSAAGAPSKLPTFKLDYLASGGTLLLVSGLVSIPVLGISPAKAWKAFVGTVVQLKFAILTVMAVLALAYVMNMSGQTVTLGKWMAGAGAAFAFLSPILGWLGVAVTGSDTSSNALFGALQAGAAKGAGLNPAIMVAANSSGGVLGKMISPQNLAIAGAAVGMSGKEGEILRKVFVWSVGFLLAMMVIVFLMTTPVLGWMVP